jgi:chorismate synthase
MPEMAMSIQASSGFHFGDGLERISLTESLRNAQINNGVADFMLTENDLVVEKRSLNPK